MMEPNDDTVDALIKGFLSDIRDANYRQLEAYIVRYICKHYGWKKLDTFHELKECYAFPYTFIAKIYSPKDISSLFDPRKYEKSRIYLDCCEKLTQYDHYIVFKPGFRKQLLLASQRDSRVPNNVWKLCIGSAYSIMALNDFLTHNSDIAKRE